MKNILQIVDMVTFAILFVLIFSAVNYLAITADILPQYAKIGLILFNIAIFSVPFKYFLRDYRNLKSKN